MINQAISQNFYSRYDNYEPELLPKKAPQRTFGPHYVLKPCKWRDRKLEWREWAFVILNDAIGMFNSTKEHFRAEGLGSYSSETPGRTYKMYVAPYEPKFATEEDRRRFPLKDCKFARMRGYFRTVTGSYKLSWQRLYVIDKKSAHMLSPFELELIDPEWMRTE